MVWRKPFTIITTDMAVIRTEGIICSQLHHGEHGVIARVLTPEHGLMSGYVRGGRSRTMRPILIASNKVMAEFRNRNEDQLSGLTVELVESRGPYLSEPLASAGIDWVTALMSSCLAQDNGYPRLYSAMDALLSAICGAPSAKGWARALVQFEMLTLSELGFGLDLEKCAVTGETKNLHFMSPKSGRAVSLDGAAGHERKLLTLPHFIIDRSVSPDWDDIFNGLQLTGYFLERNFFSDWRNIIFSSRNILIDRLKRVVA